MLTINIPYSLVPFACSKWEFLPQFKPFEQAYNKTNHGVHFRQVGGDGLIMGMEFPCFGYSPMDNNPLRIINGVEIAEQVFGEIRTPAFNHPESSWSDIKKGP